MKGDLVNNALKVLYILHKSVQYPFEDSVIYLKYTGILRETTLLINCDELA